MSNLAAEIEILDLDGVTTALQNFLHSRGWVCVNVDQLESNPKNPALSAWNVYIDTNTKIIQNVTGAQLAVTTQWFIDNGVLLRFRDYDIALTTDPMHPSYLSYTHKDFDRAPDAMDSRWGHGPTLIDVLQQIADIYPSVEVSV